MHRAGEGAPFSGLKAAGELEPGLAEADRAPETGSANALVKELLGHIEQGVRERFARTAAAKRHASHSVADGRVFVVAYVDFVHLVEKLATSTADSQHASEAQPAPHVH